MNGDTGANFSQPESGSATQQAMLLGAEQSAEVDTAAPVSREGRALIGYLPHDQGVLTLNGRRGGVAATVEQLARLAAARAAVAHRQPGVDQTALSSAPPPEMASHIAALRMNPASAQYFYEGWTVQLVDLARVCAFQPQVVIDSATSRVAGVDVADPVALASITLPLTQSAPIPSAFDPTKNAFIVSSSNPNLRVTGVFQGQVDPTRPDIVGLGFTVQVVESFVQVAALDGRYFLRDGYHRCLGLLRAGVNVVPAFVRDDISHQELIPQGMLPYEAYAGQRPPLLPDFWDDSISASVPIPVTQKIIIVQSSELGVIV